MKVPAGIACKITEAHDKVSITKKGVPYGLQIKNYIGVSHKISDVN